jgi:hypothetical protein
VACRLNGAECFHKRIVVHGSLSIKESTGGWYTMPHPTRTRGKPVRLRVGNQCHIFYTDLAKENEQVIFDYLVRNGVPGECLKRPVSAASVSRPASPAKDGGGQVDNTSFDAIWSIFTGPGTHAERMVRASVLLLGMDTPEGPMCDWLAEQLGCSPRLVYKATADQRPAPWKPPR